MDDLVERLVVDASGTSAAIHFRGSSAPRVIEGRDCEEVLSAAALIVAIALRAAPPASSGRASAGPAEAEATQAQPRPTGNGPTAGEGRGRDGLEAETAGVDAPPPSPPAAERGGGWGVTLGVGAEANDWLGPWPAAVVDASLEALAPTRSGSLRVAVALASADTRVGARRAEFRFWGGHVDLCPLSLGGDATWRWTSCLEGHLGLLRGSGDEGSALAEARTRESVWGGLEASARVQTPPLWVVRFEAEVGLALPLVRRTFRFGVPEQPVFQDPALGVVGRVGVLVPLAGQQD